MTSLQMRWDALPVAYRRTIFHTDEEDDLVRLPVAVGATGRDNISSVELRWASSGDPELERSKAANNKLLPTSPHFARCEMRETAQALQ